MVELMVGELLDQISSRPRRRPGRVRIFLRYVRYLLWEFRIPVVVFIALVLGGGLLIHLFYDETGEQLSYSHSCYVVFMMIFFEPVVDFPEKDDSWILKPLFFLVPVIGVVAIVEAVVRLAYLIFAAKRRLQEWQVMVASLYRGHVVVLGLGRAGVQIVKGLVELGEPVVLIERNRENDFLDEILDLDVTVVHGDGRQARTLEQANVGRAAALIAATSDDLVNLDAVLTARDLNPQIRAVMRLFDDTLARKVAREFAIPAISTAKVSAGAFIAAATNRQIVSDFELAGRQMRLLDLVVSASGRLVGRTIGLVQQDLGVNVVLHLRGEVSNPNPSPYVELAAGDHLLVIADPKLVGRLQQANHGDGDAWVGTGTSQSAAGGGQGGDGSGGRD